MAKAQLDLIEYEIFYNKIMQIMEESKEVVRYLSGSTITRESGEVLVAYYLPEGPAAAIACGILMHVMNVTRVIRYMRENRYEEAGIGIYEGDQFINNDAYIGGMHVPDTAVVAPFFYKGEFMGYVASLSHTTETGGIEPGGMCPSAKEAPHDGFHMVALKLVEKGVLRRDIWATILRATRDPVSMELDIKARIAGNERAIRRLTELVDNFGVEFFKAATRQMVAEATEQARTRIKELKPGIYTSRTFSDSIGVEADYLDVIQLEMEVTQKGELILRMPIIAPQGRGFDNAYFPAVEATTFYTLLTSLLWDARWNSGIAEVIKFEVPKHSRLNADPSCSVGYATVGICTVFCNALVESLSKAYYVSGKESEVMGGTGTMNMAIVGGIDDNGRVCGSIISNVPMACGGGARIGRDGHDSGVSMYTPRFYIADTEGVEMIVPFMQLQLAHRPDSGGMGKYRGGASVESINMVHRSPMMSVVGVGQGSHSPTAQGLFGGYPGAAAYFDEMINTDFYEKMKQGKPQPTAQDEPQKYLNGDYLSTPRVTNVPARIMKSGDMIIQTNHGGGPGLGDPIERDPEMIVRDLEDKEVTLEVVQKVHAVAIDPVSFKIDYKKTEEMRKEKKKERLSRGIAAAIYLKRLVEKRKKRELPAAALDLLDRTSAFSTAFAEQLAAEEREALKEHKPLKEVKIKDVLFKLTPYLNIVKDETGKKVCVCSKCGFAYCDAAENYKLYSLIYDRDPEDIQPGRLSYDKNWCIYREFYCPGCGTQIEVEAGPPGIPILQNVKLAGIHYSATKNIIQPHQNQPYCDNLRVQNLSNLKS